MRNGSLSCKRCNLQRGCENDVPGFIKAVRTWPLSDKKGLVLLNKSLIDGLGEVDKDVNPFR